MKALLAGATGLVGARVLDRLARDAAWDHVTVLVRTPPRRLPAGPDRIRLVVSDFDHLHALRPFPRSDAVFCCLGTTIRKAGSTDAFRRVDRDYVIDLARRAKAAGATRFALVSALGADPGSRVFYSRVKGEVERDLRAMDWPHLAILRPSMLDGDRAEFRLGERVALALAAPFGLLIPAKWRPIAAEIVAAAMVSAARDAEPGTRVIESDEIRTVASRAR